MDSYISMEAGMFIDEIFEAYGEQFFRDLETNTLKELKGLQNTVIATGGGIVLNPKHKALMDGKIIYLDVSLLDLHKRCIDSVVERPLLEKRTLNDLYLERKELYEAFADLKVSNTDMNAAIDCIVNSL